jgi:hypothetical protein
MHHPPHVYDCLPIWIHVLLLSSPSGNHSGSGLKEDYLLTNGLQTHSALFEVFQNDFLVILFRFSVFSAFVRFAGRTNAVRHLGFIALWAYGHGRRFQKIVRPSLVSSGFGMSLYWIWHNSPFSIISFLF